MSEERLGKGSDVGKRAHRQRWTERRPRQKEGRLRQGHKVERGPQETINELNQDGALSPDRRLFLYKCKVFF